MPQHQHYQETLLRSTYGNVRVENGAAHLGDVTNNYLYVHRHEDNQALLLKALYYESINSRKAQILSVDESTCQWVWSTGLTRWLKSERAKLFWIRGKPGSGKSTLMKYLGKTSSMLSNLAQCGNPWVAISFFFDFRLANGIGNSAEGLLRTLLDQIVRQFPDVASYLDVDALRDPSLDRLRQLLGAAINLASSNFLVLIDGLDEFDGNMRSLLALIMELKRIRGLKMLLASRPEAMIREMLDGFPSLNMADHNWLGIQQYVTRSIEQFRPLLDSLQLQDIQDLIHARAEGVFLWVYLALEEILQACVEGATADEVREQLNILPAEVEALYQRILNRIPPLRKTEAAVIYTLVASATHARITLELLQAAMRFLASSLGIKLAAVDLKDQAQFERRVYSTMGGLLDVYKTASAHEDSSPEVRLIHETVRAFSKQNNWADGILPREVQSIFPENSWSRLCCRSLLSSDGKFMQFAKFIASHQQSAIVDYEAFVNLTRKYVGNNENLPWLRLIYHSAFHLPSHAIRMTHVEDVDRQGEMMAALNCRLSTVHCALFESQVFSDQQETMPSEGTLSLMKLMAIHHGFEWISSQPELLTALSIEERDELVLFILKTAFSWHRSMCCSQPLQDVETASVVPVRKTVNIVLSCNKPGSGLTSLHIGIFLFLGYRLIPTFLDSQRVKGSQRSRAGSSLPVLPRFRSAFDIFPQELPLFIWACEYSQPEPEAGANARTQLAVLLKLGVDIHQTSKSRSIVQYILLEHVIKHVLSGHSGICVGRERDLGHPVEKLYALEQAGATFKNHLHIGTKLSQSFKNELHRESSNRGFEISTKSKAADPPERHKYRLLQLQFMLEHKETTGHLPQPMRGIEDGSEPEILTDRTCNQCKTASLQLQQGRSTPVHRRLQSVNSNIQDARRQNRLSLAEVRSHLSGASTASRWKVA